MKTFFSLFALLLFLSTDCAAQRPTEYILLPENLNYFRAERNRNTVTLSWQTRNEQNSKGFKVQRKTAGGWETIVFVPSNAPNGSSSVKVEYEYSDVNPFRGVSQYQVIETTNDYKQKASEVKAVKGESQTGRIMAYPNPSNDGRINLLFDNANAKDVTITDLAGRVVKNFSNVTNTSLLIENLQPGLYLLRTTDRVLQEAFTQKIIINKQ